MAEDWSENPENDGITLGPEEALRREIEKSKSLKVEKLQLKDALEKAHAKNRELEAANRLLAEKITTIEGGTSGTASPHNPDRKTGGLPRAGSSPLALYLLVFNILALAVLAFFMSQK